MNRNQEFKARARQDLGGSIFHNDWLMAVLVCLVVGLILSGPSAVSTALGNLRQKEGAQISVSFFSAATVFLTGPLTLGLSRLFLRKARTGAPMVFGELFTDFRRFWDSFLVGFMPMLFTFLWALIPIAGIFLAIPRAYGWAMVYYLKVDDPSLSWRACMDRSTAMMQGHRWELFTLQFSFIGWYLLGALALGVGTYWVDAYRHAAETHFYEALRRGAGPL